MDDQDDKAIRAIGLGPDNAGPIQFKVGQKWRGEDGDVVTITTLHGEGETFTLEAQTDSGTTFHYLPDGRFLKDTTHPADLTILVSDVGPDHPVRKDDGGPAFPVIAAHDVYATGMTLRDYFAAKAMQGIAMGIINPEDGWSDKQIALWAYEMADAMLIERAKK